MFTNVVLNFDWLRSLHSYYLLLTIKGIPHNNWTNFDKVKCSLFFFSIVNTLLENTQLLHLEVSLDRFKLIWRTDRRTDAWSPNSRLVIRHYYYFSQSLSVTLFLSLQTLINDIYFPSLSGRVFDLFHTFCLAPYSTYFFLIFLPFLYETII